MLSGGHGKVDLVLLDSLIHQGIRDIQAVLKPNF